MNPKFNRWTGDPHEHKAEIARRKRQAKALEKDVPISDQS